MVQWWRLTRNQYGRAVYEALARRGITATSMIEYVRPLETLPGGSTDDITVDQTDPNHVEQLDVPRAELRDSEEVHVAWLGETPVGYLFQSVDTTLEIHPLERELSFDGGYLRRVYVAPKHRQQGVASALVVDACRRVAARGADRTAALVAADNIPSQSLFERLGFRPLRTRQYLRVGPLRYRSTS